MSDHLPATITLQIGELDDETYPVRLFSDGKEVARADIPKGEFDREDAAKWTTDPVLKFLEEPDASGEFENIGKKLYALLHRGDVAARWDELRQNNQSLRTQFEVKAKELTVFPWELAYDEDEIRWLALTDPAQSFIRYSPAKVKSLSGDSLPLRVLIVVGTEDDDKAVLPLEEIRRIEDELYDYDRTHAQNKLIHRMIDFEILKQPDLARLEKAYREIQPHIFHFIGHGGINANDKAFLLLKFKNDQDLDDEIEWTDQSIRANFNAWQWIPRFVFINACRTETAGLSGEEILKQSWSIGKVFRALGVPAVLTMQADINGEVAGIFGATVYKYLAKLEPLDRAVMYARTATANATQLDKRDWATPVLTLAAAPEEILSFKVPCFIDIEKIKACQEFTDIQPFSDRAEIRRRLIRGFYPLPPEIADKNLVIVNGEDDSGKTWLVKWFLEVCALLGNDVRYVEVSGSEGKRWLDVLLQIRGGDKTKRYASLIYDELDETAFRQFYWELQNRFEQKEPPALDAQKVVIKDDYKISDSVWTPNFYTETIPSFVQALIQSAQVNRPLIVVLDHFQGILDDDMKKELIPGLIRPAAEGKLKLNVGEGQTRSVKLIVVLSEKEIQDFEIKTLVGGFYPVPVTYLSKETFSEVVSEYLHKINKIKNLNLAESSIEGLASIASNLISDDCPPSDLKTVVEMIFKLKKIKY